MWATCSSATASCSSTCSARDSWRRRQQQAGVEWVCCEELEDCENRQRSNFARRQAGKLRRAVFGVSASQATAVSSCHKYLCRGILSSLKRHHYTEHMSKLQVRATAELCSQIYRRSSNNLSPLARIHHASTVSHHFFAVPERWRFRRWRA